MATNPTGSQESRVLSPPNRVAGMQRSIPAAQIILKSDEDNDIETLRGSPAGPSLVVATKRRMEHKALIYIKKHHRMQLRLVPRSLYY